MGRDLRKMRNSATTDFLIVIDGSYFLRHACQGAVTLFTHDYPEEAKLWIKPAEEVD